MLKLRRCIYVVLLAALGTLLVALIVLQIGWPETERSIKVNLDRRGVVGAQRRNHPKVEPIRIAVAAVISPKKTFVIYEEMLSYIEEELGRPVELVQRTTYAETNELIKTGNVKLGFVCSGAYIEGKREFGMELLVAPKVYGKTEYHSYFIVSTDSDITDFTQLRGKTFAFSDPLSNSGKLVATFELCKMGETPDTYFKKYIFTHSHDNSIKSVADGLVDGASVDSLIWEYENRVGQDHVRKTRVIWKSPPYAISPVVVPPGLNPDLKRQLKEILLNMHNDPKGKRILNELAIDEFTTIDDSAYDGIREMRAKIEECGLELER